MMMWEFSNYHYKRLFQACSDFKDSWEILLFRSWKQNCTIFYIRIYIQTVTDLQIIPGKKKHTWNLSRVSPGLFNTRYCFIRETNFFLVQPQQLNTTKNQGSEDCFCSVIRLPINPQGKRRWHEMKKSPQRSRRCYVGSYLDAELYMLFVIIHDLEAARWMFQGPYQTSYFTWADLNWLSSAHVSGVWSC